MKFPNLSDRFDAEDIRQGAESFMAEFSCCVAEKVGY